MCRSEGQDVGNAVLLSDRAMKAGQVHDMMGLAMRATPTDQPIGNLAAGTAVAVIAGPMTET